jgi:hypothetical protein
MQDGDVLAILDAFTSTPEPPVYGLGEREASSSQDPTEGAGGKANGSLWELSIVDEAPRCEGMLKRQALAGRDGHLEGLFVKEEE